MFDIGLGEILVIGVVALIIFGPDRLPQEAARFGKFVRMIREQAAKARAELDDSLGPEISDLRRSVQGLDPRRALFDAGDDLKKTLDDATSPAPAPKASDTPPPRIDPDLL